MLYLEQAINVLTWLAPVKKKSTKRLIKDWTPLVGKQYFICRDSFWRHLCVIIHLHVEEELRCVIECKILISPEKLKRLATWCVHQASQLFTRLIIHKVLLHCCCINPRGLSTRCDMWHAADHMWCDMLHITMVKKGGNWQDATRCTASCIFPFLATLVALHFTRVSK